MKRTLSILLILGTALYMTVSCKVSKSNEEMKTYYNDVLKEISSEKYSGRSLYNEGIFNVANYIIGQLKASGIGPSQYWQPQDSLPEVVGIFGPVGQIKKSISDTIFPAVDSQTEKYFQKFAFPMNLMTGDALFEVDGKKWNPTVDYVFKEFSPTSNITGEIVFIEDTSVYTKENFTKVLNSGKYAKNFIVLDFDRFIQNFAEKGLDPYKTYLRPLDKVGGIIFEYENRMPFFKSRSSYNTPFPVVSVQKPFSRTAKTAHVKLDAQMFTYPGRNIIAEIKGSKNPDEYIVCIAHYDHLGVMGKENIFCGANDNGSGTAMLLTLAKHYSQPENKPEKSMLFIFFDAEEANLLGSWFNSANPVVPLNKIKYMVDFDMIGDVAETPESDILHVQCSATAQYRLTELRDLNAKNKWFTDITVEELCDDSDNYPYDLLGVPVMYFSIDGKYYKYYHTPLDRYENSSSDKFDCLFDYCKAVLK